MSVHKVGIHGGVRGFSGSGIEGGFQSDPVLLQFVWDGEYNVVPISILSLVPRYLQSVSCADTEAWNHQ